MVNWHQLLVDHYDEIVEIGIEAYKEAKGHRNLRYILEMNKDGDVYYWYDIAGGNNIHISTYNGFSIEVIQNLCFQYEEYEISDESIRDKLKSLNMEYVINELEAKANKESTTLEIILRRNSNLIQALEQCIQD